MENIEKLLMRRKKVINNYPQSDLPVGTILTNYSGNMWGNGEFEFEATDKYFDDCPAIFQPLQWHEERMPEEMPQYVKYLDEDRLIGIWKVINWELENERGIVDGGCVSLSKGTHPATESDYLSFINKK